MVNDKDAAAALADLTDLDGILADDGDIEVRRQAIIARHGMDGIAPVMSSLARISGLTEALDIEVRFIRRYLGGTS